jgi:hypothetical protein
VSARRSAVVATAIVLAALAARVEPAAACSCALQDPRTSLADADAAFVGALVERRENAGAVTLVFRIERVVKGRLGRTVEVRTAADSAGCGIQARIGSRVGLFLFRDGARWTSTLCSQLAPEKLLAAARPLPPPSGKGPVAVLVGGRFGSARTLALDSRGRTLAYGLGAGTTVLLAACPGAGRAVEIVRVEDHLRLAVRRLPGLRVVWSRRLPLPPGRAPAAVSCADRAGESIFVFATDPSRPRGRSSVLRVTARTVNTVWQGTALSAWLGSARAYLSAGERGDRVLALALRDGRARQIARVPAFTGPLVPSPDGHVLAGVTYPAPTGAQPSRFVLVDLRQATPRVRSVSLPGPGVTGSTGWLSADRVAFFPSGASDVVRVYDRSLRVRSSFGGWQAQQAVLAGERAYGLSWSGILLTGRLPNGPPRRLVELPSPLVYALAAVPRQAA